MVAHGNPRLLFNVGGYVVITGAVDSTLLGPITIDYTEEPASQVRLSPLYTRKSLMHSRLPAPAPAPGSRAHGDRVTAAGSSLSGWLAWRRP